MLMVFENERGVAGTPLLEKHVKMKTAHQPISSPFAAHSFSLSPQSPQFLHKNLDFGTLETNEEMGFDLMVASNAGYRISFSSLNNGKLDNLQRGIKLDYTVKVAGSNINLSNSSTIPTLVAQGSGITGNAGTRIPVNVKIGTVNDNQWGDYQDYITITAATND